MKIKDIPKKFFLFGGIVVLLAVVAAFAIHSGLTGNVILNNNQNATGGNTYTGPNGGEANNNQPTETLIPVPCISNWDCDSWSRCRAMQSTRTCNDLNSCPIPTNEPETVKTCSTGGSGGGGGIVPVPSGLY